MTWTFLPLSSLPLSLSRCRYTLDKTFHFSSSWTLYFAFFSLLLLVLHIASTHPPFMTIYVPTYIPTLVLQLTLISPACMDISLIHQILKRLAGWTNRGTCVWTPSFPVLYSTDDYTPGKKRRYKKQQKTSFPPSFPLSHVFPLPFPDDTHLDHHQTRQSQSHSTAVRSSVHL